MQSKIEEFYKSGKINQVEFQVYSLFVLSPLGHNFLKFMFESVLMEEVIDCNQANFAWIDGRRSVWRDLKHMINKVDKILEKGASETDVRHDFNYRNNPIE